MKLNLLVKTTTVVLVFLVSLIACDDNTGNMGYGMLPEKPTVTTTEFNVTSKSILSGPVFARSSTGFLGRFIDPIFGEYETSFLTELNCLDSLSFPSVYSADNKEGIMAGDSTDLTELTLYYKIFYGDPNSQNRVEVYKLDAKLEPYYFTDIHPEDFYDESKEPLATKTFTPIDYSYSDSILGLNDFYPHLKIRLPKEFGEEILRANRDHPEYFYSSEAFINNILKGLYIKTVEGDGAILYIDQAELSVRYVCHYKDSLGNNLKKKDGTDSLYRPYKVFPATREVVQANHFKTSDQLEEKVQETEHTYLKSPAGIFTELTLPYTELEEQLRGDTLNIVKLEIPNYYEDSDYKYKMSPPSNILLLRKSELETFFKDNKLNDNITSYEVSRDTTTNIYRFRNLNRLVQTVVDEKNVAKKKDEKESGKTWTDDLWNKKWKEENPDWDKVVLVPIAVNRTTDQQGNSSIISIQHDLRPGYVKLKGGNPNEGGDMLNLKVVHSHFKE